MIAIVLTFIKKQSVMASRRASDVWSSEERVELCGDWKEYEMISQTFLIFHMIPSSPKGKA